jgi:putative membrane protein
MYLFIKAIHIISIVAWFAAILYMGRLLVYFAEAQSKTDSQRRTLSNQLGVMQKRLWSYIATPAMIATLIFGVWLMTYHGNYRQPWMHTKLLLVACLLGYTHLIGRIYRQQNAGKSNWDAKGLRFLNESGTLFLVGIVFTVVVKSILGIAIGVLCLAGAVALIGIAFRRRRPLK